MWKSFDVKSLRFQQIAIALVLALTPIFIVGGIVAERSFSTLEEEAVRSQGQEASVAATQVETFITDRQEQLELLTTVRRINTVSIEEQQAILNSLIAYDAAYQELALLDSNGLELAVASRSRAFTSSDLGTRAESEAYTNALNTGDVYYTNVSFDADIREPLLTISVPIRDLFTNEISHVLLAEFRFRPIWNLIADLQTDTSDSDVYVVNSEGRLLAHANPSLVLTNTIYEPPEANGRTTGLSGEDVILAQEPIRLGNQTIIVIAEQNYATAIALANDLLQVAVITLIVSAIVVLGVVTYAQNKAIEPILRLTRTAHEISGGKLTARATVSGPTEIKQLATSFNSMTQQLQDSIGNLEHRVSERTRDLQVAADVSTQITTVLERDKLLDEVVRQLQLAFDYYHIGIYRYQAATNTLQLTANTIRGGQQINNQPPLLLDSQGVVTKSARTRLPVVASDVAQDHNFKASDQLPTTRSELAVPMVVGDELIGVLDLQSDEIDRFTEDDLQVIPLLAKQIGIAIQNARSYSDAQAAKEQAEEANRVKSQFLANMSHELRTPLNAILNFTAFVADGVLGDVNEEQVNALNQSISSGKHLLALINDILDITKIEAGLMDLFIQEVEMGEVIGSAVAVGKGLVKGKSIKFIDNLPDDLPNTFGDKRRLRQVFLNIISNAVKFTPEGSVTVTVIHADKTLMVTVEDTGIGIAPEDQPLVFESFKQAKHELDEAIGTGLGMPISKYFVESHGGRIWLESEPGVGTTFHVELPVMTEQQAREMTGQHESAVAVAKG